MSTLTNLLLCLCSLNSFRSGVTENSLKPSAESGSRIQREDCLLFTCDFCQNVGFLKVCSFEFSGINLMPVTVSFYKCSYNAGTTNINFFIIHLKFYSLEMYMLSTCFRQCYTSPDHGHPGSIKDTLLFFLTPRLCRKYLKQQEMRMPYRIHQRTLTH